MCYRKEKKEKKSRKNTIQRKRKTKETEVRRENKKENFLFDSKGRKIVNKSTLDKK